MSLAEDLGKILIDGGVVTLNTTLFYTSKANIPTGAGPYLNIAETGGTGSQNIHNDGPRPSYIFPGAQIWIRGSNPVTVKTMARAAWMAIAAIRNQTINGTWYRKVTMVQGAPYDFGLDDTGRQVYVFNVLGDSDLS